MLDELVRRRLKLMEELWKSTRPEEIIVKIHALDVKDESGTITNKEILVRKRLMEDFWKISSRLESLWHQKQDLGG